MNYCSHCGSNDLQYEIPEGDNFKRCICGNCGRIHYQNPLIVVGCIPLFKGRILLARRNIDPQKGLWNLPCGFMEMDETVEEGALREVKEETEAEVELIRLHTVYNLPHANQVYVIFLAKMTSDHFATSYESSEVRLFLPEDIPWREIAFSSNTFALEKFLENPRLQKTGKVYIGTFDRKRTGSRQN